MEEYRMVEGPISTSGLVQPPDLKVKEGRRPPSQSYLVISELSGKLSNGLGSSGAVGEGLIGTLLRRGIFSILVDFGRIYSHRFSHGLKEAKSG